MADLRVILEVDYGRETAESMGASGPSSSTTASVTGVLQAHPDGGGGLLGVLDGWVGWEPVAAAIEVEPRIVTWLNAEAKLNDARWFVEGIDLALPDYFANGRQPLVATYTDAAGALVVEPAIQIDGLALAQAGAAATFRGTVQMQRLFGSSLSGQLVLGDFVNDQTLPGANPDDLSTYCVARLSSMRWAGVPHNVGTTNDPRLANQCAYTFSDPYARVWLGPSDLGLGPLQLPPDVTLITAAKLQLFPSIFMRRTTYVRGVRAVASASVNPVNTGESAPRVLVANERPAFSRWRIFTDKRVADAWVRHPDGADLRTPLAVWNSVFAADVLGRNIANPFPLYRFAPGLGRGGFFVQGVIARNQYIEAAEFMGFAAEDGEPIGEQINIGPNP